MDDQQMPRLTNITPCGPGGVMGDSAAGCGMECADSNFLALLVSFMLGLIILGAG